MKSYTKFETKDLPIGELGQTHFREFWLALHQGTHQHVGTSTDKYWDEEFLYRGGLVSYEVKTDKKIVAPRKLSNGLVISADSGNLFIEFKSRDELSGISITTADYFVVYLIHLGEFWIIETEKLRKLINTHDFYQVSGGDDLASQGWLIPRQEFREYFDVFRTDFFIKSGLTNI